MNTQPRPAPPGGAFHDARTPTSNDATTLTLNVAQHQQPPEALASRHTAEVSRCHEQSVTSVTCPAT